MVALPGLSPATSKAAIPAKLGLSEIFWKVKSYQNVHVLKIWSTPAYYDSLKTTIHANEFLKIALLFWTKLITKLPYFLD